MSSHDGGRGPHILIVGLGLMGGSLGMALKTFVPDVRVGGSDLDPDVAARALSLGAIDRIEPQGTSDLSRYEVIFAATPVRTIPTVLAGLAKRASAGTILTDLGSAKGYVHRELVDRLPSQIHYVGGHPMAGSEIEGLDGADPHLYENAVWILTDPSGALTGPRKRLEKLLSSVGALVVTMDPLVHDRIVSMTSHLPYLAAVSLVNALLDRFSRPEEALSLAAGGFFDTTRVAGCPPPIFRDIMLANRENVLEGIDLLMAELESLRSSLRASDQQALDRAFGRARELRSTLPRASKGYPVPRFELVVRALDQPGFLGKVATLLGDARINIKDFLLMHIREGEPGTILLAFLTDEDLDRAHRTLTDAGMTAKRR